MKKSKYKTILVLGGAGFIGSNFIRFILSKHPDCLVINFDKLTYSGNLENLKDISSNSHYRFIRGDIANREQLNDVFFKFKPRYVINFAAETHVDRSIHEGAEEFFKTNAVGVFNLLEVIRQSKGIKKFVQVSTDEVYGDLPLKSRLKFKESSLLRPSSPYASSKASGDLLCLSYFRTFGTPVVITRCGNNYGPYQYPEKLIPFFILKALHSQKLPLYGTGENVRDWVYVLDHCRALESCLFNGQPGKVYNIGSGNERSNLEIAKFILDYFDMDYSRVKFVHDRPGHDLRYALDSSLIKKELKWRPKYNFEKSLNQTINWYLDNKKWLDKIKNKLKINRHI